MVIPGLEAARVVEQPGVFTLLPWSETEDPSAIVGKLAAGSKRVAIGDQMWARFLVELLPHLPGAVFERSVDVVGALRMRKDQAEVDALAAAGAAVGVAAGAGAAGAAGSLKLAPLLLLMYTTARATSTSSRSGLPPLAGMARMPSMACLSRVS